MAAKIKLPAPPVPAWLDLTSLDYMPLYVGMLRDSRFAATVSREAGFVAVLLWSAAWHQVPASSLPDDDQELAHLAGFGRDLDGWKRLRAEALYGFILCSDGRLYHRVIAERAIDSQHAMAMAEWRRDCDRVRKENRDRKERSEPELPKPIKPEPLRMADGFPAEFQRTTGGVPGNSCLKGKVTEGKVTESSTAAGGGLKVDKPKAHALPADWQPSERNTEFARKRGHSAEQIADIAEDFRAKHTVGPRSTVKWTDWDRAWESWIRKEPVRQPRVNGKRGMSPPAPADAFNLTTEQQAEQEARLAAAGLGDTP